MLNSPRSSARRNARRGAIAVLVAVSLVAVLGCVAICIDGGGLLDLRRKAQATADAAALAAAENLFRNFPTNQGVDVEGAAADAAYSVAALNGFDNDDTRSVVTVRTSPQTYAAGPNAGMPLPRTWRPDSTAMPTNSPTRPTSTGATARN